LQLNTTTDSWSHNGEGSALPEAYRRQLLDHIIGKVNTRHGGDVDHLLVMYAGGQNSWLSFYLGDPNVRWKLRRIRVDSLTLTGLHPEWHPWIAEYCDYSPVRLRQLLQERPDLVGDVFSEVDFHRIPILVLERDGKHLVLDGMHRTVHTIVMGQEHIWAYVTHVPINGYKPETVPDAPTDVFLLAKRGRSLTPQELVEAIDLLAAYTPGIDDTLQEWLDKCPTIQGTSDVAVAVTEDY